MPDPISTFFEAWQLSDADARAEKITGTVSPNVKYDDPRTSTTVSGVEALCDYVGRFSANAPGWTAKVLKSDTTNHMTRATVAFSGMGPDGTQQTQLGQYYIEKDGDLISRMVGFVGTGEPE